MANGSEGIAAALAEAASEETAESTAAEVENEVVEAQEETETTEKKGNFVPKSRLDEVIGQRNDLKQQLDDLSSKHEETQSSLTKLTQMFEGVKADADIINDIRALAKDPRYKDQVEAIDRALRGVEEEVEKGDLTEEEAAQKTSQILERKQGQLEEQIQSQQLKILTNEADAIAEKWLEQLPEQYTDADRKSIAHLWTALTDFDVIEENPDGLVDFLKESFQQAIDVFGTPRGALVDPNDLEEVKETEVEPEAPDPDELLAKLLEGKNYGGILTDKNSGKISPEVSDEDFTRDLSLAMKIRNTQ